MRDLKHLIFFEDLLQEANNDLVKQAKGEGKRALGYTCYFMPEVLLDLPGCFGVRLRAPRCTSPDIATYYMSGRTCHYGRSLLERALEGGYNFLDARDGHGDLHRDLPLPGAHADDGPHPEPGFLLRIHRRALQKDGEQL